MGPTAPLERFLIDTADDHEQDIIEMMRQLLNQRALDPKHQAHLADGGAARVDLVVDPALGRHVARKTIHEHLAKDRKAVAGLIREAHITAQLEHPSIVPVYDLDITPEGHLYFTMKQVHGQTLEDVVAALPEGPLEQNKLLDLLGVVIKICDALSLAHSRGVIHCDIKPLNIMVGQFGEVYLMDWGIARMVPASANDSAPQVQSWVVMRSDGPPRAVGTPSYMAPEQARGKPQDARTDIFAVGALLYFLLTRRPPFVGAAPADIVRAAARNDRVPLDKAVAEQIPRRLLHIIQRAMASDPDDRYPRVEALRDELQRFIRGGGDFPQRLYPAGAHVVRKGDLAKAAFIIARGRCEVYTTANGAREHLRTLERGDVFGEIAILAGSTRTASVVALEDTTVLEIPRDVFEGELDGMKPWMGMFTRTLACRFREMLNLQQPNEIAALPSGHPLLARAAHLTYLGICTWGELDDEGHRFVPWIRLSALARTQLGLAPDDLRVALGRDAAFSVHDDRVVLIKPRDLRARLWRDLAP